MKKLMIILAFLMLSSGYTTSNPKTVRDMEINIMQLYFASQLEQAIILCDESLKTWPNNPDLYYWKGRALSQLKRYQEALEYLDLSIKFDDHPAGKVFFMKAYCLDALGSLEAALKNYNLAIEHGYNDRSVYFAIDKVEDKLGK